jgi:hypothetical protein
MSQKIETFIFLGALFSNTCNSALFRQHKRPSFIPENVGYFCYGKWMKSYLIALFQLDLHKLCKDDCVNNGLTRIRPWSIWRYDITYFMWSDWGKPRNISQDNQSPSWDLNPQLLNTKQECQQLNHDTLKGTLIPVVLKLNGLGLTRTRRN